VLGVIADQERAVRVESMRKPAPSAQRPVPSAQRPPGATLCQPETRRRDFGDASSTGLLPANFTAAFGDDFASMAGPGGLGGLGALSRGQPPPRAAVAVFNFGLHLLGGYVDSKRWAGADASGSAKAPFIRSVEEGYPSLLRRSVEEFGRSGYKHVIFRTTNAVADSKFHSEWRASVDACSESPPARDAPACAALLRRCEAVLGLTTATATALSQDVCRRLAFDARGASFLNTMAAEALLSPPGSQEHAPDEATPRGHLVHSGASTTETHGPSANASSFFAFRPGARFADHLGYLDAHRATTLHPECTPDGRHYFQVELVLARVLADALVLWKPSRREHQAPQASPQLGSQHGAQVDTSAREHDTDMGASPAPVH
jgi:hypothetical protein